MRYTTCSACDKVVETRLEKCPDCGAKLSSSAGIYGFLAVLVLLFAALAAFVAWGTRIPVQESIPRSGLDTGDVAKPLDQLTAETTRKCMESLECWTRRASLFGTDLCATAIDDAILPKSRWTSSLKNPKFSRIMWLDQKVGTLILFGDRIEVADAGSSTGSTGSNAGSNADSGPGGKSPGDGFTQYSYYCHWDQLRGKVLEVKFWPGPIAGQ